MLIEELTPEQPVTFSVMVGEQLLEFSSKVIEALPRKHMILVDPIIKDDKILSLRGKGILVNMLVTFQDQKPHIFQNVDVRSVKNPDNSLCYTVTCATKSMEFNRRKAFRCFVGVNSSIKAGANSAACDVIIKDVSATGFSFTAPKDKVFSENEKVHTVLNDYIEETSQNYSFHLFGTIIRSNPLENGNIVYGCKFTSPVTGIQRYIMEKERIRLRNTRGTGKKTARPNDKNSTT